MTLIVGICWVVASVINAPTYDYKERPNNKR
jgi:hypothetical protein